MPPPPYVDDHFFRPHVSAFNLLCSSLFNEFHIQREISKVPANVRVYVGYKHS